MKRILFVPLLFTLPYMQSSSAAEFYTIIGPDGRPIVVQQKSKDSSKIPVAVQTPAVVVQQPKDSIAKPQPRIEKPDNRPLDQKDSFNDSAAVTDIAIQPEVELETQSIKKTEVTLSPVVSTHVKKPLVQSASSQLDQEEYINNEYLEEREFNLDGKKRFYAMPEGVIDGKTGGTRMQMVEREKGVSQSVLQSLFKREPMKDDGPLVLSPYYHRVAQQDAVNGLGQACFTGKKIKKAKTLEVNEHANLWPRAAIKDEFDFEVVKVKQPVHSVQIRSYSSGGRQPTFYWPFAVFLDEKACVIEGAGGFKNQDYHSNALQHETIEGIFQLPQQTHYILLTPLASAIDLDNRLLSNQGQVKLIAIR